MERNIWAQKLQVMEECHQEQIRSLEEMHELNLMEREREL